MNISTKQNQTHRHREQTRGCQGRGKDWEFGISRLDMLLVCTWIKCMDILWMDG